jgi:PKD repeat protein
VDPADCGTGSAANAKFAKFYNFSSADGTRQHFVDLDGKGRKAMPGPCITCHGGRGDPLTPDEGTPAKPRFPLVENSVSRKRGDVQARLHGMNVGSFGYSAQPGFSRAEQEAKLKDFNQWILCSYPLPAASMLAEDQCRPVAGANEWQGTAAELIKAWYGGPGMSQGTFADTYVPSGWNTNPSLYTEVVAPYCRTCHILRGTANQNDIDFTTLLKFQIYADRIKSHVFDRGNMPLAFIVYDDFWKSSAPNTLANFINPLIAPQTATDASGAALRPGRPIADPGPSRMVRTGANAILTGENSLFATSYNWTLVFGSATITNPNSMIATFNAGSPGSYTVQLTVGNGAGTNSKDITITVDNSFPDPSTLRFAQVKNVLQNVVHKASVKCTDCHVTPAVSPTPPIFYNTFDRNGAGGADTTDDTWFLKELRGRVNLTEIQASPLLRKPSGNHHAGNDPLDLTTTAGLRNYSIFYNWILAGMPPGGLVANAGADSTDNLVFAGSPATDTVALDGSASIGATSYAWTIFSAIPAPHPNGTLAAGTPPSITQPDPALPEATLNVFDIGTYVVRLMAINGSDPDEFDDRTITVTETAVGAVVSPSGTQSLNFSGGPPTSATLNLSSAGTTGSPLTYSWFYFPSGLTTGPCGTISNASSATAILTVPESAIGSTCAFRVSASNVSTTGVATTTITIAAAAGQNPNASYTATTTTRCTVTGGATATPSAACTWAGNPFNATIGLSGSATGIGTLTYQWSLFSGPAGSSFTNSTSPTATLNIVNDGVYVVRLFVDNGALSTGTIVNKTITVSANRTFTQVSAVFINRGCTGCHASGNPAIAVGVNTGSAPSWENVNDTNGDSLYTRVVARVNVGAPASSLLVLNPLGSSVSPNLNGHGGGQIFTDESDVDYITFLTWIIGGVQP